MAIDVITRDATVQGPVIVEMTDRSGAHVELTLAIGKLQPIHHAFAFSEGTLKLPVEGLKHGTYACTLIVQAFKHKTAPNRMYDDLVRINGKRVATCQGDIPADQTNDSGFGDFTLTVN